MEPSDLHELDGNYRATENKTVNEITLPAPNL